MMFKQKFKKALFLGDTHFPYASKRGIAEAIKLVKSEKPDLICQVGDLLDMYSFSKYAGSVNKETPYSELMRGHAQASEMWEALLDASPDAQGLQVLGNHCIRMRKRAMEKLPELEGFFDANWLFEFDDVYTHHKDREPARVSICGEPVSIHHGFLSKAGDHVRFWGESCVLGHTHRGQTHFEKVGDKVIWECNAGFLGDQKSHVFGYGSAPHKWTLGVGLVDANGPRFVSF